MNRKVTMINGAAVAVALAAAIAANTRADDSSIGRFSDGYAYFNQITPTSKSPSAFRQSNPHGLSTIQLEALSSGGAAWHPARAVDKTTGPMPKARPKGPSEGEFQALSANSSRRPAPDRSQATPNAPGLAIGLRRTAEK